MLVSLDFDCLQVLSCYFCSSWRCWLAVEVRDKCVTKLPSFWREDRLLCSHSCFFSLSLFYTLSQFVWERFYTFFFFSYSQIHLSGLLSSISQTIILSCHLLCFSTFFSLLFSIICRFYKICFSCVWNHLLVHSITVPNIYWMPHNADSS